MRRLPSRRSPCRGRAFPQKSINFEIILIWECSALNSQRRDNLSVKANRAEHLRFEIVVGNLKIFTQMLCPYKFVVVNY